MSSLDWTEVPDPDEYRDARRTIAFLASSKGHGYTVRDGYHNDVENGTHDVVIDSPEGEEVGNMTHDEFGHVGYFYMHPDHHVAIPKLLTHVIDWSEQHGWAPPHAGGAMTPQAYKFAKGVLPNNTRMSGAYGGADPHNRYER